ncbi:MAG: hypothetical protein DI573_08265 [Microbacterium sp.]|uniref:sensor histidine kinase n=1 Tax=Microbacterium sp. TaxID=51671 RepID=UPI000DB7DDDA|nr:ATP-binding protein [Microbacterium sp.]PZU39057.1 MAG: hypothetical protein DI573_08265 [Microbacterium sp.]
MTGRRIVAGAVWGISWALALASLTLQAVWQLPQTALPGVFLSPAPAEMQARFDEIGVTVALIYGPVSAMILARRPHPVGVILAVHAVGSGIAAFGVQYGLLGAEIPGLPLWGLIAFAAGWGFVPGTFMTAALPLLVRRDAVPAWQRGVIVTGLAVAVLAFVASLTQQSVAAPVNPLAIDLPGYQAVLAPAYTALSFAAVTISVLSCGVLIGRWTRARGRERTGVAWLTLGHLFLTFSYILLVLPAELAAPRWVVDLGMIAPVVGQVLYPAAILVFVLGQRLWGVEMVISRVILWASLTIGGVAVSFAIVAGTALVLPGVGGLWVVTPIVIALAVQPLRVWLQRRIDALVYGEGADPVSMLARLGDRIGDLEPGAAGLQRLCDAIRRVLRLGFVEVRAAGSSELVAASGRAPVDARGGGQLVRPLMVGARRIGDLIVAAREGQRLDRRTRALLDDIVGLVAAALQLVEAGVALEQARADLLARRAAERRAVRRELHDGLGPALAGIGFGLAATQNLLRDHPERARALLAELGDDLTRRARAVRELAGEVTPSPLEGATLGRALREIGGRFDSPALAVAVRVDAGADDHLPPPVRDGLYLIASEALANAVRHARATRIEVRLERGVDGDPWMLRISDDGRGIAADAPWGVGMRSMRERAAELGARLEISTGQDGTTLALVGTRAAREEPGEAGTPVEAAGPAVRGGAR